MNTAIWPIENQATVRKMVQRVKSTLEERTTFSSRWLTENRWIAVPKEGHGHFSEEEIGQLLFALSEMGVDECFAVALEELRHHTTLYGLQSTTKGLYGFNGECGPFYYVLTTLDTRFCILCSPYDYKIYGGCVDDVERLLGTSVEQARKEFSQYASMSEWQEVERKLLLKVERSCSTTRSD